MCNILHKVNSGSKYDQFRCFCAFCFRSLIVQRNAQEIVCQFKLLCAEETDCIASDFELTI